MNSNSYQDKLSWLQFFALELNPDLQRSMNSMNDSCKHLISARSLPFQQLPKKLKDFWFCQYITKEVSGFTSRKIVHFISSICQLIIYKGLHQNFPKNKELFSIIVEINHILPVILSEDTLSIFSSACSYHSCLPKTIMNIEIDIQSYIISPGSTVTAIPLWSV